MVLLITCSTRISYDNTRIGSRSVEKYVFNFEILCVFLFI